MNAINEVITELKRFSSRIITINEGVIETKIHEFEEQHHITLPHDYKILLRWSNGLCLMGTSVFGIYDDTVFSSLGGSYKLEHFEVGNEMPLHLVPFSPDGGGNHYCFDMNQCDEASCKVVFWQHDLSYDETAPEVVNNNFKEWVQEVVIDWTLEEYDYEGNEKR